MPQSLSCVHIHLVFSTKNRRPFLRDPALRSALHGHLGEVSKRLECPPAIVGGVEDHVHILARLGRPASQADWIKELKRVSSQWVKAQPEGPREFEWQAGYGAFAVSISNVPAAMRYIATQEERHRKMNYQDELRGFLREHELEWDERYLWE